MPDSDECKHGEVVGYRPDFPPEARHRAASQRDVQVPQAPLVEAAMPASPKVHNAVIVAHAADHVLWRINAVEESPEAEESPGNEELEPDVFEVEESQHAELGRRVDRPVWFGMENGNHVHVMDHDLHGEQDNDKTYGVHFRPLWGDTMCAVALLRNIVIEGDDGAREVEGRIRRVCEVVAKGEVGRLRRRRDSIALGQV